MRERILMVGAACVFWFSCDASDAQPTPGDDVVSGDVSIDADSTLDGEVDGDTTEDPDLDSNAEVTPTVAVSLGITGYLDVEPDDVSEDGDVTTYTFSDPAGPRCLRGSPYRLSIREGDPDRVLIFMQGGGACWSEFCLAVTRAPAGIPMVDVLNPDLEVNPFATWSVVYLPYCDGSLFAGDRDHDDDGDGEVDRFHRGLQNMSAGMMLAHRRFPEASTVVVAGSSGGGYGTMLGSVLARHLYPDASIRVVNDSGLGLARDGDDAFLARLLDEFGVADRLPPDCATCLDGGHLTGVLAWIMERDEDLHVAVFSSWYDSIISEVFLQMPPQQFQASLARETDALSARFGARYRRFVVDGKMHTTLLGNPIGIIGQDLGAVELPPGFLGQLGSVELGFLENTAVGDVHFHAWLRAFISDPLSVEDVVAAPSPLD